MNMKYLRISIFVATSIFGCTTNLDPEANLTRKIQPDWAIKCKFLGNVTGGGCNGFGVSMQRKNSLNDMRNNVHDLGGNAYVVTDEIWGPGVCASVSADAYNCPEQL